MQSLKPRRKSPHPKILSDHALASSWWDSSSLPIWLSEEYYVQKIRPRLRKNKVREIFKQHGGFVTVHSEPGQGSTFRVHIPLISGVADRRATPSNAKIAGGTETILVAEDHDGLQEVIRRSLESKGYTVLMARNGEELVCLFEENWQKIGLAVLEVMMPVMQGPDAYAKMCAVKPDLPVIFTTGHAAESILLNSPIGAGATLLGMKQGCQGLARGWRRRCSMRRFETRNRKSWPLSAEWSTD